MVNKSKLSIFFHSLIKWELETTSQNVHISELKYDRWLEENAVQMSYVNDRGEDYSESSSKIKLAENVIIII